MAYCQRGRVTFRNPCAHSRLSQWFAVNMGLLIGPVRTSYKSRIPSVKAPSSLATALSDRSFGRWHDGLWCWVRPCGLASFQTARVFMPLDDATDCPFVRGIHQSRMDSLHKELVMRSFDVFFHVSLNKQSRGRWIKFKLSWCSFGVVVMIPMHTTLELSHHCACPAMMISNTKKVFHIFWQS